MLKKGIDSQSCSKTTIFIVITVELLVDIYSSSDLETMDVSWFYQTNNRSWNKYNIFLQSLLLGFKQSTL